MDFQGRSSSDLIGSDLRIVCAKLRLSVRTKSNPSRPRFNWDTITTNQDVAPRVENQL